MKKKYRVRPAFTLDPFTGFPKNEYRIEYRRWGKWYLVEDLEPFDTSKEAYAELERRDADT